MTALTTIVNRNIPSELHEHSSPDMKILSEMIYQLTKIALLPGRYAAIDLTSVDYVDDTGFCVWIPEAELGRDIKVQTLNDEGITITIETGDIPFLRGACRFKKVYKAGTDSTTGFEAWN